MRHAYSFRNVNEALPVLCRDLLQHPTVPSRQGLPTKEMTHVGIELRKPLEREILIPERRASIVAQVAETAWVLSGSDKIEWLSRYLPRAADFSDDGKTWRGAYGPRLRGYRDWGDQLAYVYRLLSTDPGSRRAVINIYDPGVDSADGKDIPCNNWLHFLIRNGKLHCHVAVRSNDLIWGWSGINAFEWSVVQEILASWLAVGVGSLHFSISSLHIYENHWKRARDIAETTSPWADGSWPPASPRYAGASPSDLDAGLARLFAVEARGESTATTDFPIDPMLASWLRVLRAHNAGDEGAPAFLEGLAIGIAYELTPRKAIAAPASSTDVPFSDYVSQLHADKHAAYGDSWKRRGEMLGIMANIARKVDRLGTGGSTADETALDTAVDLLVYLCKYRWWLYDDDDMFDVPPPISESPTDEVGRVSLLLKHFDGMGAASTEPDEALVEMIKTSFDNLEPLVADRRISRWTQVDHLIRLANRLARHRYWKHGNERRAWNPEA